MTIQLLVFLKNIHKFDLYEMKYGNPMKYMRPSRKYSRRK
jgi:hypothetical protein